MKTQTRQFLEIVIPKCLAEIIEGYIKPPFDTSFWIGFSGYGELCLQIEDCNGALAGACYGGYMELTMMLITCGANDYNLGLFNACFGGYVELAHLMIAHGATDYNLALRGACYSGDISLAKLMISYGANDWDGGLYYACAKRHFELARLMITGGGATVCTACNRCLEAHVFT